MKRILFDYRLAPASVIFLWRNCAHRDLHSFPTRRSSDLFARYFVNSAVVAGSAMALILLLGAMRSEEHTSELQSHSDLVCRLLLEKKNIAQIRAPRLSATGQHAGLLHDMSSVSFAAARPR